MNTRIYVTFSEETYKALERINDIEHRHSMSNTVVAIVERQLPIMREEWLQTGKVKLSKSCKNQDKQDIVTSL